MTERVPYSRHPVRLALIDATQPSALDQMQAFYDSAANDGLVLMRPAVIELKGVPHIQCYAETQEFRLDAERAERVVQREILAWVEDDGEMDAQRKAMKRNARLQELAQDIQSSMVARGAMVPPGSLGGHGPRMARR